ncbi:hypothetical protein GC102_11545 [Paenibacillus sp. LMG 31460]|uniref:Transcriptional regulator n=1 Tax=Paenibacillus germinis TaxID=2654979 RepID=A0ABX1Z0P5_9BACL|nr:hypothetical protein [Paenibacillus germinis]NOU86399.1 hypothetical protein [Paenibacillus germinis]
MDKQHHLFLKGTELLFRVFLFREWNEQAGYTNTPNLKCGQMAAYNDDMDKVFKALADSSRRQLLDELFKKI